MSERPMLGSQSTTVGDQLIGMGRPVAAERTVAHSFMASDLQCTLCTFLRMRTMLREAVVAGH
jgi:hypothetical protein